MEKKEIWANILPEPQSGETSLVPAIYLKFCRVQDGERPGVGRMMGFESTLYDNTLTLNGEHYFLIGAFQRTRRCSKVGARAHAGGLCLAFTPLG